MVKRYRFWVVSLFNGANKVKIRDLGRKAGFVAFDFGLEILIVLVGLY
jgi:hypothetical protein